MKKFLATILVIIYLASVTGAGINVHYCLGQLADWNIGHSQDELCATCGMQMGDAKDNSGCKNELKQFKIDIDQQVSLNAFSTLQLFPEFIPASIFETPAIQISLVSEKFSNSNAPRKFRISLLTNATAFS